MGRQLRGGIVSDITFTRASKRVPCPCEDGPCGYAHYAYDGPARFYIGDVEVTEEQAREAYYGGVQANKS